METSNPPTGLMAEIEELESVIAFSVSIECDIDEGSCSYEGSKTFY